MWIPVSESNQPPIFAAGVWMMSVSYTHLPAKIRGHAISPLSTRAHLYTVAGVVRPAGAVAYFVRDGKLRSPNPLCALSSQTPALRLYGSTEPVIPSLKGGVPHRFPVSYTHLDVYKRQVQYRAQCGKVFLPYKILSGVTVNAHSCKNVPANILS